MSFADVIDVYEDDKIKKISISGACLNYGTPVIATFRKSDTDDLNKTVKDFVDLVVQKTTSKTPIPVKTSLIPVRVSRANVHLVEQAMLCDEDGGPYRGGGMFYFARKDFCIISIKSHAPGKTKPTIFKCDTDGKLHIVERYKKDGTSVRPSTETFILDGTVPDHSFNSWNEYRAWRKKRCDSVPTAITVGSDFKKISNRITSKPKKLAVSTIKVKPKKRKPKYVELFFW